MKLAITAAIVVSVNGRINLKAFRLQDAAD